MSEFSGYSSKASAVRGLNRFLGVASRDNPDLDLNALIVEVDGKVGFYHDAANEAVGLGGLSEEDEGLKLGCGHVNCPECGIHLSNGLMDFDTVVDRTGSEKAAYAEQKHEWSCMACYAEWGKPIDPPVSRSANKTGRTYTNRAKSDVEKPSEIVFRLADADRTANRKDIVAKAVAEGVTINTANAAYQHWRKARGLTKPRA